MSDHHAEREHVRKPVEECLDRLKLSLGLRATTVPTQLAIENLALRVLREERARRATPPPLPPDAKRLPASMDPHDRPTRPDGLPRGAFKP